MGCLAIVGFLPLIFAVAALVDIYRNRAEWYWCPIVFLVPYLGAIAYFAVAYGPWNAAKVSPVAARRQHARQRLKTLDIQLSHWRGPAVLAEAGEHLLALGRLELAESRFREALAAGAEAKQVHLPLAEILMVRGRRYQEAAELLRPLYELDPDFRFGAARLAYARCLDELGDHAAAEQVLRDLLVKRNPPEARVRLARLALRRGDAAEARELLQSVLADGPSLLPAARRQARVWLRAAKKLRSPEQKLPAPTLESSSERWPLIVAGVLVLAFLAVFVPLILPLIMVSYSIKPMITAYEHQSTLRRTLAELERELPARPLDAGEPETLTATYLAIRREVAVELERVAATRLARMAQVEGLGLDVYQVQARATEAENALLEQLIASLRRHQLHPADLVELAGRLEWLCLEREIALFAVLPSHFRGDWLLAERQLASLTKHSDSDFPERERQVAETQAKLADLRAMAPNELPATWSATCAQNRAELASLKAEHLWPLAQALIPGLPVPGEYDDNYED